MKKELIILLLVIFLVSCTQQISNEEEVKKSIGNASIGFIGCTNKRQTVYVYGLAGGQNIWEVEMDNIHDYDSGGVYQWINNDEHFWEVFDKYHNNNPQTNKIW